MQVVRGKEVVRLGSEQLDALLAPFARVVIDVGTGDGRLPYRLAQRAPDTLYVGIDANADNMREASHRALRKPSRGGVENVVFVLADAEDPPDALEGRADEVLVILPWGRLMVGLLRGERDVLAGIARLARPGAALRIVINGEVWGEPVPIEARDLPPPTVDYVHEVLRPIYRRHGISICEVHKMTAAESASISSTWAKRLRHGRPEPNFLEVRARFREASTDE